MSTAFTAKVKLASKTDYGNTVGLSFTPDYADGRNAEWAEATPSLSLSMSVRRALADQLDEGAALTLTFKVDEVVQPED